jgi:hypothetical protein
MALQASLSPAHQRCYKSACDAQVLDVVPANDNDSMVGCAIPAAGPSWGMCASVLMMLQDATKTTFVNSSFVNVVSLTPCGSFVGTLSRLLGPGCFTSLAGLPLYTSPG